MMSARCVEMRQQGVLGRDKSIYIGIGCELINLMWLKIEWVKEMEEGERWKRGGSQIVKDFGFIPNSHWGHCRRCLNGEKKKAEFLDSSSEQCVRRRRNLEFEGPCLMKMEIKRMRDNEQLGSIIMGGFEWDLAELTGKFGNWIDKNEQKKKKKIVS